MRFFTLPALLASAFLSAVVVVPFVPATSTNAFALRVTLRSDVTGLAKLYHDDGSGFTETRSTQAAVSGQSSPEVIRLPLPAGTYRALRFDPIDRAGSVQLGDAAIVGAGQRVIRALALTEFQPANEIASAEVRDGVLAIVTAPGARDPQLLLTFAPPLVVSGNASAVLRGLLPGWAGVFIALGLVLLVIDRLPGARSRAEAMRAWGRRRPIPAMAAAAALAVVASAYPVVFLGQSHVSPNLGTKLLYEDFPTLPGYEAAGTVDVKLADIGAVMWAHVPYSTIQHRALRHGEFPLWNRYNAAGVPLLAQGQSMLGDPVHLITILANGAAWAWDLKYLVAKWLLALGLGLTVLALTGAQASAASPDDRGKPVPPGPALLVAIAAPFIGFFIYRVNHPAFFSLCYAPWPLYCLVRVAQASTLRQTALWILGLFVANLALMNSGTVKEAYMLLACMNFSGGCIVLAAHAPWRERLRKLGALAWAGIIFALVTMPVWATFLATLKGAYTTYNVASAFQIQPTLLLGAFDEIFYRPLMAENRVFNPSLNFALLLGLLYFLATLRVQLTHRAGVTLAATSLVPLALAFGLFSPRLIENLPFLGNVAHLDNTFSCALIILWSVLAGLGFATAAERLATREGRNDLIIAGLLLFALVFGWIAFRQVVHRPIYGPTFTVNQPGQALEVHPFIWKYLAVLLAASTVAALAVRGGLARGWSPARVLVLAACGFALLGRHGLHARAVGFETFVVRPTTRVDFHARSAAIEHVRAAHKQEPARAFGISENFVPGWTAMYGLETIHGPDALVNPWLRELVDASPVERLWEWRLYATTGNVAAAQPFFDALNVRHYLDRPSNPDSPGPTLSRVHAADLEVFESPTAWPRAFFCDRLAVYERPAEVIAQFESAQGQPLAAVQRADFDAHPSLAVVPGGLGDRTAIAATGYILTENSTSFSVRATGPGIIVLTEALWPGDFRAELNGVKARIVRVNHAFKGVVVDAAGEYRVVFRYLPKNFPRHLALSGLGVGLLAASLLLALRRPRAP